jgi:hypothetical protein
MTLGQGGGLFFAPRLAKSSTCGSFLAGVYGFSWFSVLGFRNIF